MSFDGPSLVVAFIVSGVGFVCFSFGKKMSRYPQLLTGIGLMVFPYFVSNVWLELGIAVAMLGAMVFALSQGW